MHAERELDGLTSTKGINTLATEEVPQGQAMQSLILWIYPWISREYPGRLRGTLELLPRFVTHAAVGHWRRGKHIAPRWAKDALAAYVEARSIEGLALAAQLRATADPPPAGHAGFRKVREDGMTRRGTPWLR